MFSNCFSRSSFPLPDLVISCAFGTACSLRRSSYVLQDLGGCHGSELGRPAPKQKTCCPDYIFFLSWIFCVSVYTVSYLSSRVCACMLPRLSLFLSIFMCVSLSLFLSVSVFLFLSLALYYIIRALDCPVCAEWCKGFADHQSCRPLPALRIKVKLRPRIAHAEESVHPSVQRVWPGGADSKT